MAKQLKSTGLAATALHWFAVDPDTNTVKDFASSAVTADMTVGANVTVGDLTWDGITQKYFRNGAGTTDADFIKFGATKPSWAVNSTTPQRTYVALVQIENTTTRVFGTSSTNYFFSRDSGSGGDTYPRLFLNSNAFTAGLPPPSVGAKVMFGFRVNRGTACGWFEADDTDSSLNTGSQAIGAVNSTWSLDYLCRRNDSTSNTRGYFVAVGVFDGLPSDAQLLALLDDPSGYMLESAGGSADVTHSATLGAVTSTLDATVSAGVVLSHAATLGPVTQSFSATLAPGTTLTHSATLGAVTGATSIFSGATITSPPLKRNNGGLVASTGLTWVSILDGGTGALLGTKTGVSTDAAGRFAVRDDGMIPGSTYQLAWLEAGGERGHGWGVAT